MSAIQASDLWKRLCGALFFLPILLPILLGIDYAIFGLTIAACWLSYEYTELLAATGGLSGKRSRLAFLVSLLASFAAGIYTGAAGDVLGFAGLGICLIVLGLVSRQSLFSCVLAICLFSLGIISQIDGFISLILFVAIIISACDIGAYCCGRIIGGAKLAPAISPSKTWSGSIGGMLAGILAGYGALFWFETNLGNASPYMLGWMLLITILAQIGDLYESWLKRQIKVKDSSQLIPGHGGVLDRFDGYLLVLPVIVVAQHHALLFTG